MEVGGARSQAHILYMDVIGSGKLSTEAQRAVYEELNEVVAQSPEYRRAGERGEVLCRPSGDGMAMVFFEGIHSPLLCALEIAELLRQRPHLRLRMGVHSGPVLRVTDINGSDDVTGEGIVGARRVMDCGDAGHILVSASVVDAAEAEGGWKDSLRYLGVCEVKHGQRIALWNLSTEEVGNPKMPQLVVDQLAAQAAAAHREPLIAAKLREGLSLVVFVVPLTVVLYLVQPLLALLPPALAAVYVGLRAWRRG